MFGNSPIRRSDCSRAIRPTLHSTSNASRVTSGQPASDCATVPSPSEVMTGSNGFGSERTPITSGTSVGEMTGGYLVRAARITFELIGLLVIAALVLREVAQQNPLPIWLPGLIVSQDVDSGTALIQGTWRLATGDDAWPNQTTTIRCYRAMRLCDEATAVLAESQLMPVTISTFKVVLWDGTKLIIEGDTGLCARATYRFDIVSVAGSGTIETKEDEACFMAAPGKKTVKLIDGYQERRLWYRRLART